jgi:hypothetical protein
MMEMTWLQSHVRQLLQAEWNLCRVEVDCDGDVPFPRGTAACWVSVVAPEDELFVRVWAHVAYGVKRTLKLTSELDEINARTRTVKVYWCDSVIIAEQAMHAEGVTQKTLGVACEAVGGVADDVGTLIAAMFGGATPFPPAAASDESDDNDESHHSPGEAA